jgi:nitrogen fixation NifU-like protein
MGQFSETLMDHFNSPRNCRRMETPNLVGLAGTPGNGPYVALYIRLDDDSIIESCFQTHGCGVSIACGSMLTELITHRSITECLELTPERLSAALDGVPATKLHCPVLAIAALKDALKGYGTPQ